MQGGCPESQLPAVSPGAEEAEFQQLANEFVVVVVVVVVVAVAELGATICQIGAGATEKPKARTIDYVALGRLEHQPIGNPANLRKMRFIIPRLSSTQLKLQLSGVSRTGSGAFSTT